jgi:hypothetical protein
VLSTAQRETMFAAEFADVLVLKCKDCPPHISPLYSYVIMSFT